MKGKFSRKARSATSLEGLDNAYLQGLVQIIDAAIASPTPQAECGPILAHLMKRGIFSPRELAQLGKTQERNIHRWAKDMHIPRVSNTPPEALLDNIRGKLTKLVQDGR